MPPEDDVRIDLKDDRFTDYIFPKRFWDIWKNSSIAPKILVFEFFTPRFVPCQGSYIRAATN